MGHRHRAYLHQLVVISGAVVVPTFVNRELGADLQLAGFLALAPTIVSLIMAPLAGRLFDRLVARGRDRLKVRCTMQSLAFVGITAAMMGITLTDSLILSVTVITLSNALTAFSIGGFAAIISIAPNQSGLLMGVTNTLAAVSPVPLYSSRAGFRTCPVAGTPSS